MDKKAMYNLTYGLYILTARDGEKDNGCIINTACQVTTEPNRITICVNKNNFTHDIIFKTGLFNISMLTEKSKFATYKHWGFQSGKTADKVLDDPSATYAFYQKNIKAGSASKEPGKKGWICTVCGYVYEGEELPPDFVCPWCNHDASYFEKRG